MKIEVDIAIPDGWEFDRIDQAREGDYVLHPGGRVDLWERPWRSGCMCVILRKKPNPLKWPEWANDPAWDWMQAIALDSAVNNDFILAGYDTKELTYNADNGLWGEDCDGFEYLPSRLIATIYPPGIKPENSLIVREKPPIVGCLAGKGLKVPTEEEIEAATKGDSK